jgi:hypothetical protein
LLACNEKALAGAEDKSSTEERPSLLFQRGAAAAIGGAAPSRWLRCCVLALPLGGRAK